MKKSIFKKLGGLFLGLAMGLGVAAGVTVGNKASEVKAGYEELFTITSDDVVNNSGYQAYTYNDTDSGRKWVITFGGNNKSVGTNSSNRSKCTLSAYSQYAVSPVTTSDIASAFVSTTSISDVSKISYTINGGSNQTNTNVYLIYSSDGNTFSQMSITSGTQGAAISSGTAYEFTKCSGYFGLVFKATNSSGNWRIDDVNITFYKTSSTPVTSLTLGGTGVSNNKIDIGSSDTNPHAISVSITSEATDQRVNIAHQSGTSGLFTLGSSQITCSSGSGSFTITGKGNTSGSETFRVSAYTETSVYQDLVVTAFNDSLTYYTVSFDSTGGSPSPSSLQVEEGKTFTFPSPGTKEHFTFNGWSSDGGTTKYLASATSPSVTSNTSYSAYWTEDAKYTVTYVAGSSSYNHENQYSGTYTLLPFNSTGLTVPEGYRFKDYTVNGDHKEAGADINITGATTVTANFEVMPRVDTLNRDFTGVDNGATSYATWTGKTGVSGAVYAGNSAGSNDSIQLRSSSPAGIITTASGGTVKKITVVWESHSASGRTIDIYGKNTAYTEPANLYASDEATKGTKLGSIVYGTSTELTITDNYEYIGIRSSGSALYLSEIQIEWQAPNALISVSTSGQKQSFTAGETFSYGGTLTAHYSVNADAGVTPKEFRWGSATGSEIDATKALTFSDNGKVVYVIYEEGDVTVDAHYSITVSYKPASGIELDYSSYKLPLNGSFELTATVSDEYADLQHLNKKSSAA